MKNEINKLDIQLTDVAEILNIKHTYAKRTFIRMVNSGDYEGEYKEAFFKNKMNREYPTYLISKRIESDLYVIYNGTSNARKSKKKYNAKKPFLYIMKADKYFKIGLAVNPEMRLKEISTNCPFHVELIMDIPICNTGIEAELHERYKDKRFNGEWFLLEYKDIYDIAQYFKYEMRRIPKSYDTFDSVIFELYNMSYLDVEEIENMLIPVNIPYHSVIAIRKMLTSFIDKKINVEKLPFEEIIKLAKEEVNKLADSLCFKPIN